MPVIPALREPEQEDIKFETSLGYKVRPYLNKTNRKLFHLAIPFPLAISFPLGWRSILKPPLC